MNVWITVRQHLDFNMWIIITAIVFYFIGKQRGFNKGRLQGGAERDWEIKQDTLAGRNPWRHS